MDQEKASTGDTVARGTQAGAFKAFAANIKRARAFIRIFHGAEGRERGQPTKDEKELLRGAIVFAVGALDAYLHDVVLEIVPRFGPEGKSLQEGLKQIAKEDPGLALRVALAATSEDAKDVFRGALSAWLDEKSFQGPEAVVRVLGYLGLETKGGVDALVEEGASARLQSLTEQRHNVVHRATSDRITRDDATNAVDLVESVASAVNALVKSKYDT